MRYEYSLEKSRELLKILLILLRNPNGVNNNYLAEHLQKDKGLISEQVNALQEQGFVTKEAKGREVIIRITTDFFIAYLNEKLAKRLHTTTQEIESNHKELSALFNKKCIDAYMKSNNFSKRESIDITDIIIEYMAFYLDNPKRFDDLIKGKIDIKDFNWDKD